MKNKLHSFKEFRPALIFLFVFTGLYLVGNFLYGTWIEYLRPAPDPATIWVSRQAAWIVTQTFERVSVTISSVDPLVILSHDGSVVIRVFEGCNGINVMIVFVAFITAFRRPWRQHLVFLFGGLAVIHVANICRVVILYVIAIKQPLYFYYFHKYLFTAVLYCVVFILWYIWVQSELNAQRRAHPAEK